MIQITIKKVWRVFRHKFQLITQLDGRQIGRTVFKSEYECKKTAKNLCRYLDWKNSNHRFVDLVSPDLKPFTTEWMNLKDNIPAILPDKICKKKDVVL